MALALRFVFALSSLPLFFLIAFYVIQSEKLNSNFDVYCQTFRYYDSKLSRMIQPDDHTPGGFHDPRGLNRFAYVFNSPFKYTDPSGNTPQDLEGEGWQPTSFYFMEHPYDSDAAKQTTVLFLDRTKDLLNAMVGKAGEFTYKTSDVRGRSGAQNRNHIRFYMRGNEGFDQSSKQAQVFRGMKVAFTGDPVYFNGGEPNAGASGLIKSAFAKKSIGHPFGNTDHDPYDPHYAFGIGLDLALDDTGYFPLGRDGGMIVDDLATSFGHEIGHVAVEKSFTNAFMYAALIAQEKTGIPVSVATRVSSHVPEYMVKNRSMLFGPPSVGPLDELYGMRLVKKGMGIHHFDFHPQNRYRDLQPGVDPIVGFENIVRGSLNEQLGIQKYGAREYYRHDTGREMQRKTSKSEERMKDY